MLEKIVKRYCISKLQSKYITTKINSKTKDLRNKKNELRNKLKIAIDKNDFKKFKEINKQIKEINKQILEKTKQERKLRNHANKLSNSYFTTMTSLCSINTQSEVIDPVESALSTGDVGLLEQQPSGGMPAEGGRRG